MAEKVRALRSLKDAEGPWCKHTARFLLRGAEWGLLHSSSQKPSPSRGLCSDKPFSQNRMSEHHDSGTIKGISRPGSNPVLQKSLRKGQS